ncbi:MAG: LysE family transporter [Pseudomonadota bacterium]
MTTLVAGWLVFLVAAATPGPSTLAIASLAVSEGRGRALRFVAGVVVGSQVWGLLAVLGFAAAMEAYASLAVALKLLGAAYLALLAVKALRRSGKDAAIAARAGAIERPFLAALALHLSNPKAVFSWLAVVVVGVPGGDLSHAVPFLLGCLVLAILINGGYALVFSNPAVQAGYRAARRGIERAVAAIFGAFAAALALSAVRQT